MRFNCTLLSVVPDLVRAFNENCHNLLWVFCRVTRFIVDKQYRLENIISEGAILLAPLRMSTAG